MEWVLQRIQLEESKLEILIKNDCIPIIGFIPNSQYWQPTPLTDIFRKEIKEYTLKNNIKFIDFTHEIKNEGNKAYTLKGTHISPLSYKIISDKIRINLLNLN